MGEVSCWNYTCILYVCENVIQHRCHMVVTFHPRIGHEGPQRDYRYSSALSWTSALDVSDGQLYALAILLLWEMRYPFYRRLCGTRRWSGQVRKCSLPTGMWSVDRPAWSCLPHWLSSAGLLLMSFGANETTSHPLKHLHVLYRLGVLVDYSACKPAVVSRCLTGETAVVTPHWDTSFVKGSGTPILPNSLHLRQVERLPCHFRLGYVFSVGTEGRQCCCWPSHIGATVIIVSYHW
jgi:hypothetical protein